MQFLFNFAKNVIKSEEVEKDPHITTTFLKAMIILLSYSQHIGPPRARSSPIALLLLLWLQNFRFKHH